MSSPSTVIQIGETFCEAEQREESDVLDHI